MSRPANNQKILVGIAAAALITAGVLAVTHYTLPSKNVTLSNQPTHNANAAMTYTFPGQLPADQIEHQQVRLETNKGVIIFSLDAAQAPLAVSSFVSLAKQGYFDGLTWHRVVPHFVIQGGDPTGTGSGGPGYRFNDETVTGEYTAGTVAMANSGVNTNGSQFFIVLEDQPTLDKKYTIFGHVTQGMDVVSQIVQGDGITKVTVEPQS